MRTRILVSSLPVLLIASCGQPGQDEAARSPVVAPRGPSASATPSLSAASSASSAPTELGCSYPVDGATDTAKTVLARFGKDARRETLGGPEGTELKGLVLWGDDRARRVEVVLDEESPNERVAGIRLPNEGSRWRIAGLGLGAPMERVAAANGRAFTLWGFDWDYGGTVSDWRGGKLQALPGGCRLQIMFSYKAQDEVPWELLGDSEIASDHPKLPGIKPYVVELGLNLLQTPK